MRRCLGRLASLALLLPAFPATVPAGTPAGADCQSSFTTMQVLGDFNGWYDDLEPMSTDGACLWSDTLYVDPGCSYLKFRSDLAWFPSPNYGRCTGVEEPCQSAIPTDGAAFSEPTCLVGGELGTAIGQLEFLEGGDYVFTLDEAVSVYTVHRRITASGTGVIRGKVAFEDSPFLPPAVHVSVSTELSPHPVAEDHTVPPGTSFEIQDVPPGTYVVLLQATGYAPETRFGVTVAAGATTDLGLVTLFLPCESAFSTIQVLGEFNGWNENAPGMDQVASCAWADTLVITAGCSFLKFRTDQAWDVPPDYGRCEGAEGPCQVTVPTDGTDWVENTCPVAGIGTAIGQVVFPLTGEYAFRLDEDAGTYSIRLLQPVSLTGETWGGIKARYR